MRRNLALTALAIVATLTTCAGNDRAVPPWMQAILDSRQHLKDVKGAHVHRSQYPEDPALKAAGALLAKPPVRNPVVVAMTTTPTRVGAVEPAVRSLLNQSQPALIVVSIPDVYNNRRSHWNGKRIEPPAWLARLDAAARSTKGPCAPCVVVAKLYAIAATTSSFPTPVTDRAHELRCRAIVVCGIRDDHARRAGPL